MIDGLHDTRAGRWAARALTGLLAFALVLTGPGGSQVARAQADDAALVEARVRLDALFGPLAEQRAALDRTTFDLTALGLALAFEDADDIVAHVHREVRLEPYHGVLRGAEGTLASGAGNALDQALLTAVLLGDAGYETEIRRARLDDGRTAAVLAQVRLPAPPPPAPAPSPELDEAALAALEAEVAERVAAVQAEVAQVEARLLAEVSLAADGAGLLRDAAADYAWVAYRLSSSAPWREAHPVFGDTPDAFAALEPDETFAGAVPEELLHRFRFQVFVERRVGDETVMQPVTAAWERPVANLYGVPLTYANVPDGLEAVADAADTDALMAATSFFFPMLAGDLAEGAMAFDMLGAVVPPDAAASPFAGVFQSTARAAGRAAGVLGALGNDAPDEPPEDTVALTAQWFEFTFVAPGGETTTHRRLVTDRLGAEARAAGTVQLDPAVRERDAFADLASVHTFMLDPGRYADAYVLDRTLGSLLEMRGFLDRALEAAVAASEPPTMSTRLAALEEPIAPLTLLQAFAEAPLGADLVSYRPAPGLLVLSQDLGGTSTAVDVIANPRWTLRPGVGGPSVDAAAGLRAGIWETRVEALPLERDGAPTIPSFAALLGGPAVVLTPDAPGAAAALPFPRAARDAIAEDLARGYLVVAPAAGSTTLADAGWWRIDPTTGETLGRGADGRGNAFLEYLTTFEVSLTITAGFAVYGAHQCTKIEDPRVAGCCLVQNVVLAGAGVAAGVRLGMWAGASLGKALIVFGVMDVGYNVGGLFLPTLCP